MFVGATGPLVASSIHRSKKDKLEALATFSSCMTSQNTLKVLVFSMVGFHFTEWLPLLFAMTTAGALGTWVGLHIQRQITGKYFKRIFRIVMTLLAARLVLHTLLGFFGPTP